MAQTHPIFRISGGNGALDGLIADRVLSLTIIDMAGSETDSFVLRLDDAPLPGTTDERLPEPPVGANVDIEIGYADEGLVFMGTFYIDEVELSADPAWEMTIRGQSANLQTPLKTLRSDSWDQTTLGDIVSTIAGRNGLAPVIDGDLAGIFIEHKDQQNRSDHAFLTALAVDFKATFKIAEGLAIFAKNGEPTQITSGLLGDVTIDRFDEFIGILGWKVLLQYRGRFSEAISRHHDWEMAETIELNAPSLPEDGGGSQRRLPRRATNEIESQVAADSEARRLKVAARKLTLNLIGEPRLSADGNLTMVNFRSGVDNVWRIETVTHEYSTSGYTTTVDAKAPFE